MPLWLSLPIWIVLNAAALAASLLPRRAELALGPRLGRLLLWADRKRRAIASENILRCLPELDQARQIQLLEENYAHYGVLVFELLHLFSPLPGHYRRYVRNNTYVEGIENWRKASDKGKGLIFISAHMGNWEMMAGAGAMSGLRLTMVTRHLKPEWLHKKVEAARASADVRAAYQPRTLPALMKALRKGESVGFVIDQYAHPPMGIPAHFFGAQVNTLAAVGPLAQRTGAAVVPVSAYRDKEGIVHVCFEPEMDLSEILEDAGKVTQALVSKVEEWVRRRPEQWLWVHRRFKNAVWPAEPARDPG